MTTAQARKTWTPTERRNVAAAAARASIALRKRYGLEVPQWIRDAAEGRPTTPPPEHRPAERPRVAAAAARASIALRERTGREVPQWLLDTAEGRPTTPPAELT